jgi:hypothetical protein
MKIDKTLIFISLLALAGCFATIKEKPTSMAPNSPSTPVVTSEPIPEESPQVTPTDELEKQQVLQEQRDNAIAHYQSGSVPVVLDAMWNGPIFIVFIDGQRQFNYTVLAEQTCVGVGNFIDQSEVAAVQVMDYGEMQANRKLKNLGQALCK